MKSIVVLISGNGTNLQAIIDACATSIQDGKVTAVFSNKATAYGLERAKQAGAAACFIDPKAYETRDAFDGALMEQMDKFAPDLVVLAGYMRILSSEFVRHYLGRMINIHPSLLPKYPGLNTYQRAIHAGMKSMVPACILSLSSSMAVQSFCKPKYRFLKMTRSKSSRLACRIKSIASTRLS